MLRTRAGIKRPATGDRRPATGDRRPATGDRRPATGDRRPATGDRRPATGDRRPATGDRRPAIVPRLSEVRASRLPSCAEGVPRLESAAPASARAFLNSAFITQAPALSGDARERGVHSYPGTPRPETVICTGITGTVKGSAAPNVPILSGRPLARRENPAAPPDSNGEASPERSLPGLERRPRNAPISRGPPRLSGGRSVCRRGHACSGACACRRFAHPIPWRRRRRGRAMHRRLRSCDGGPRFASTRALVAGLGAPRGAQCWRSDGAGFRGAFGLRAGVVATGWRRTRPGTPSR